MSNTHPNQMISREITVISAGLARRGYIQELWKYRELLLFLAWRDVLVRYKQTIVGVTWALVRPILAMLALTLVFERFGKMPSGGAPYPLLVFCGLLPWQFFASAMSESSNSLVENAGLVSKVYFPRIIIPAGSIITASVDFLVSLAFLVILMFWYHWLPPSTIIFLPLFVLLTCAVSFGVGLWISALMVEYRDFRHIIPFAIQFGFYISPVGYLTGVVSDELRLAYSLNPIVGVIDGFRWCILGGEHNLYWPGLVVSSIGGLVLLLTGTWYFRRTERIFADVI